MNEIYLIRYRLSIDKLDINFNDISGISPIPLLLLQIILLYGKPNNRFSNGVIIQEKKILQKDLKTHFYELLEKDYIVDDQLIKIKINLNTISKILDNNIIKLRKEGLVKISRDDTKQGKPNEIETLSHNVEIFDRYITRLIISNRLVHNLISELTHQYNQQKIDFAVSRSEVHGE